MYIYIRSSMSTRQLHNNTHSKAYLLLFCFLSCFAFDVLQTMTTITTQRNEMTTTTQNTIDIYTTWKSAPYTHTHTHMDNYCLDGNCTVQIARVHHVILYGTKIFTDVQVCCVCDVNVHPFT